MMNIRKDMALNQKQKQWLLDKAERTHLWLLRALTGWLTVSLWLTALSAVWMFYRTSLLSVLVFLFSYMSLYGSLFWMGLVCRRLRILKRILFWSILWIPVLNLGLALYVRGLARQEIDHSLNKISLDDVRVEHQVCATRYPILLAHGVGFRDFHYFNYWGRIPRELVRNGARVYYGHQEAWGTVEDNGAILKEKIQQILKETGSEKVNIIAHSKGGLDARYVITGLSMAPYIASLTTINSPHRGSKLVDFLKCLPDGVYRKVCDGINWYFTRLGDRKADAYRASNQLSCAYASEFNRICPDSPEVYYQSFASVMKHGVSCKLLCVPYWVLKWLDGENDGLVTPRSAVWGNFRGIMKNRYLRGISHGDMIDLPREDYRGFRVLEFYVQMVQELKEMGY